MRKLFFCLALGLVLLSALSLAVPQPVSAKETSAPPEEQIPIDPKRVFCMPYESWVVTQGPHGQSYGHYAVDLAWGKNTPQFAPINGNANTYTDKSGYSNPVLKLWNKIFEILMLHGKYSVGNKVELGHQVGVEKNWGYTTGVRGVFCGKGSSCGYHLHLDVKVNGNHVNPLDYITQKKPCFYVTESGEIVPKLTRDQVGGGTLTVTLKGNPDEFGTSPGPFGPALEPPAELFATSTPPPTPTLASPSTSYPAPAVNSALASQVQAAELPAQFSIQLPTTATSKRLDWRLLAAAGLILAAAALLLPKKE